jgi:ABC-type spermidine/putrescine transport system permease subunit II
MTGAGRGASFAGLGVLTALVLAFLLTPVALVAWASFGGSNDLAIPPTSYSLRWHLHLIGDPDWRGALGNSIRIALVAAAGSTLASLLAATALVEMQGRRRRLLAAAFLLPLVFPAVALAVGQVTAFGILRLEDGMLRLALSHMAVCLPVSFLMISLAFSGPWQRYVAFALALSESRLFALARAIVPLFSAQIIGALVVSFLLSFDEPVLSQFVGGPDTDTVPRRIFNGLRFELDPTAAAVTFLVFLLWMLAAVIVVATGRIQPPREA